MEDNDGRTKGELKEEKWMLLAVAGRVQSHVDSGTGSQRQTEVSQSAPEEVLTQPNALSWSSQTKSWFTCSCDLSCVQQTKRCWQTRVLFASSQSASPCKAPSPGCKGLPHNPALPCYTFTTRRNWLFHHYLPIDKPNGSVIPGSIARLMLCLQGHRGSAATPVLSWVPAQRRITRNLSSLSSRIHSGSYKQKWLF